MDQFTAYTAGFFDGEGTVGVYSQKGWNKNTKHTIYWAVKLAITGTYRPVIEELHEFFEYGSVSKQKRQTKGRTPGKFYNPELCKQCWKWSLNNKKDIKDFLIRIRPMLREKASQANIVLQFINGELDGLTASKLCKEAKKFSYKDGEEIFVEPNFKGSANPMSKLNEEKVKQIKERVLTGERQVDLAKEFEVNKTIVNKIVNGTAWSHVAVDMKNLPQQKSGFSKLTEDKVRDIRRRKKEGEKQSALAKEFDVSNSTISEIVNRKKWPHVA